MLWVQAVICTSRFIPAVLIQMPYQTDRQVAFDALHQAFLVNLMAEAGAEVNQLGEESDYLSSLPNSSDTDTSSSNNEEQPTASDVLLDFIAQLYSTHYYNTPEPIPKDSNQLHLILHIYGFDNIHEELMRNSTIVITDLLVPL
jgi:hypothetical protein